MFLEFFSAIFIKFRKFRIRWNYRLLERNGDLKDQESFIKDNETSFSLRSDLLPGWYMIEIKAEISTVRAMLNISEQSSSHEFALPLDNGRTCKRIIYLGVGGKLKLLISLKYKNIRIIDFQLLRVTKKFARSRMLMKLRALHPRYKFSAANNRNRGASDFANSADISNLWSDYCAIFDEAAEVVPYPSWVKKFDSLTASERIQMHENIENLKSRPLISVVMPVFNTNPVWLEKAISSVRNQIYPYWELCIADDASTNREVISILERHSHEDARIKVMRRKSNGHISAASNSALELVQGDWVALLDHDDVLADHALFWVANAINENPKCMMIYSDEDKINDFGERSDPYFKCDWNLDLFYSQNMFSHLGVYQAELLRDVGGFRIGMEGSQDYDLAFRCIDKISSEQIHHIPRILYHWRIHADSTAMSSEVKPYAMAAGKKAINDHLTRRGLKAVADSVIYGYRVRYTLPAALPLVSLIIPTRNGLQLLKQCIESIQNKTNYKNYEIIIINNGSDERATLHYLAYLEKYSNIRVIHDSRPFNYSALNNAAVREARGDLIALINNDVEVISPDWLAEMVSHAVRPEVGAVGARLWYPDDTIQHAGVVLGIHGIAEHVHRFLPRGNVGYCGRANLIQSFSAVTAACLLVRKSVYEEVGGLNEVELQVACNDVDFCLRVREAGYRNIWTPYAELYHHESATRGFDDTPEKQARSAKEISYMQQRWGDLLLNDPAYSPNLSLDADDFSLAWPPRLPELKPEQNSGK